MGLGKTVSALASIAAAQAFPALIVVPTNVQRQWCEMAAAFLDLPSTDLLQTQATRLKGRKPYAIPETPIVVIHYGLLADWCDHLRGHGFKCIVFDEVQDLRHTGTAKYSAASALSIEADFVWGLSGTPIYNYGSEIWAVMNAIEFQCLGDWESFSREWCIGYGEKIIAQPDVLGNHLKREGLMLRRLKTEVQSQLPDKVRSVVDIDHDESVYRKLAEEAIQLARGYDTIKEFKEKGMAARKMDEQARRATGVSKAPYVAEYVNTLIEAGERPIVFAWHHDVHDILRENIAEGKAVSITGRENEMQKRDALYRFAAGEVSCCILSLRSTAGLDGLQKAGTCVVFAELDWSPAVHAQCEDRLHRIGLAAANLFCYYLVSGTSIDLVIQETLGLKVGQFINIMGDPGESEESKEKAKTATEAHMKKLIRQLRKAA
jgi:SNF2 family DNA or RNA helicase